MLMDSRRFGNGRPGKLINRPQQSRQQPRWIIERVSTPDVSKTSRGDPRRGNCSLNIYAAPRTSCALFLFSPIAGPRDCRSRFRYRLQKRHERGSGSRASSRARLRDLFFGSAARAIVRTMRSRSEWRVPPRVHVHRIHIAVRGRTHKDADETIDGNIEIIWSMNVAVDESSEKDDLFRLKKTSAERKTRRRLALAITCHRCY